MKGQKLKEQRISARIPGSVLCRKARIHRSRLSDIERGYVQPSDEELARLERALRELIGARQKVAAVAEEVGWPM